MHESHSSTKVIPGRPLNKDLLVQALVQVNSSAGRREIINNKEQKLQIFSTSTLISVEMNLIENVQYHRLKRKHDRKGSMIRINTFAASYLNNQGLNNSCLKSPASTLVDLSFQSRALRSFSLNQLRNLSL